MTVKVHTHALDHVFTANAQNALPQRDVRPVNALKKSIESLLAIQNPRGLQLEIQIQALEEHRVEDTLAALKSTHTRLLKTGMRVRVICCPFGGMHTKFPTDLGLFFVQSKKEWAKKVAKHRGR